MFCAVRSLAQEAYYASLAHLSPAVQIEWTRELSQQAALDVAAGTSVQTQVNRNYASLRAAGVIKKSRKPRKPRSRQPSPNRPVHERGEHGRERAERGGPSREQPVATSEPATASTAERERPTRDSFAQQNPVKTDTLGSEVPKLAPIRTKQQRPSSRPVQRKPILDRIQLGGTK